MDSRVSSSAASSGICSDEQLHLRFRILTVCITHETETKHTRDKCQLVHYELVTSNQNQFK